MGMQPGKRAWERPVENKVLTGQEAGLNNVDLISRYQTQAVNYIIQNPNFTNVIIGAGIRDSIINAKNKMSAASFAARNNPHLIPNTIDDLNHQSAFLIAVAEELAKPEYNQ